VNFHRFARGCTAFHGATRRANQYIAIAGLVTFKTLRRNRSSHRLSAAFEAAICEVPEVLLCHGVSGLEDFVVIVAARDLEDSSQILIKKLRVLPGVKSIRTSFSLKSIKHEVAMRLSF
jgi:DNA-binding Lrp family transcriptional regulator